MAKTILETHQLRLLELEHGDASFVVELLNSEGFLRHIGDRGVRDEADALRYIDEGPRASYASHGHGLWKMVLKSDGRPVGMCGLLRRDTLPHPDIGYALLPAFEGQGLASEAGAAVLELGFEAFGMSRILAVISPGNAGSARVLEKLGLRAQGLQHFADETLQVYALDRPARLAAAGD